MKLVFGKGLFTVGFVFLAGHVFAQDAELSYCEPPQFDDDGQIVEVMQVILTRYSFDLNSLNGENSWMKNINFTAPNVVRMVSSRLNGFEFYGPYLKELSTYPPEEQCLLATLADSAWSEGDPVPEPIYVISE